MLNRNGEVPYFTTEKLPGCENTKMVAGFPYNHSAPNTVIS